MGVFSITVGHRFSVTPISAELDIMLSHRAGTSLTIYERFFCILFLKLEGFRFFLEYFVLSYTVCQPHTILVVILF